MSFIAFAPLHVFKIKITKRTITKTQKGKNTLQSIILFQESTYCQFRYIHIICHILYNNHTNGCQNTNENNVWCSPMYLFQVRH